MTLHPDAPVATRTYRAVVRGHFDGLDDDAKASLLAAAADHDFLKSAFTTSGTFTYDDRLVAFNFRYEIGFVGDPHALDSAGLDVGAVERHALERTIRRLDQAGCGYKRLRVELTAVSEFGPARASEQVQS